MWAHWWSAARVVLGLSNHEFFELTPRQLQALLDQHELQEKRSEFLMGQLTAVTCNFSARGPKKPYKATDFMLTYADEEEQPEKPKRKKKLKPLSAQVLADKFRAIFAGMRTTVNTNGVT